jgi:hypothetical protein
MHLFKHYGVWHCVYTPYILNRMQRMIWMIRMLSESGFARFEDFQNCLSYPRDDALRRHATRRTSVLQNQNTGASVAHSTRCMEREKEVRLMLSD